MPKKHDIQKTDAFYMSTKSSGNSWNDLPHKIQLYYIQ